MSKKVKYLLHLLGPIIFIYILFQIDFGLFKKELFDFRFFFLVLAAFFIIIQIVTRAQKWRAILLSLGISMSKVSLVGLYWLGTFIGVVTPGRLGELVKVYFLKNRGYSTFCSFLSVLLDRLSDVLALLLLGFLIFVFFLKEIGIYIFLISSGLLLFLVFIFLLIDKRSFLHKIFSKALKRFFSIDLKEYSDFTFAQFLQSFKEIKKKQFFPFFLYLIISWVLYFIARYFVVLSIGLDLSLLEISVISVLVAVVTMLPISVAGIGTRDAAVIYLFSLFAISKESALLYSLIILTIDLLVVSLGLIPYFKESSLVNRVKQID